MLKAKTQEQIKGCLETSEIHKELGINPMNFGKGRFIFINDTGSDGAKIQYCQSSYVEDDNFLNIY